MDLLKPTLTSKRRGMTTIHIPPELQRASYHHHPATSPGRKLHSANHLPGHARPIRGTKARGCKGGAESPHPPRVEDQFGVASRIWLLGQAHWRPRHVHRHKHQPQAMLLQGTIQVTAPPNAVLLTITRQCPQAAGPCRCPSVPMVLQESGVRPSQQSQPCHLSPKKQGQKVPGSQSPRSLKYAVQNPHAKPPDL